MGVEINLSHIEKLTRELNKANNTLVKVGVLAGAQYPNGTEVAEVAKYLEYGWQQNVTAKQRAWFGAQGIHLKKNTTLNMPARPFFRATAEAKKRDWFNVTKKALQGLGNSDNPLNQITQALTLLGMTAQQDVQDTIQNGGIGSASFAIRSPLTMLLYGNLLKGHRTDGTPNQSTVRKSLYKTGFLSSSIAFEIVKK